MIFYPGIENLTLPMLSYPGCHVRALCIVCIGTRANGRQVTPLLHVCKCDIIVSCPISAYSIPSGSFF